MSEGLEGLVCGRFRLGELLGSGGTASVFEALDVSTGQQIALKVMHPHLTADPLAREAFFEEARATGAARGRNVVEVLEVAPWEGEDEAIVWIALERVPGMTLSELVARAGALSAANALSVAEGVLRGLVTTHDAGLVHRDVSPGNVMVEVRENGTVDPSGVWLIDFGIAAAVAEVADGEVRGNPSYVSPEQADGAPVDARGDLYQLGGVLYFALTGHAPFVRDTVAAVLEAHRSSPPPVPSVRVPGLPREVDRLVARAMVKHPDGRFSSATAMLDAVAGIRLAGGEPTPAAEAGTTVLGYPVSDADQRTRVLGARAPTPVPQRGRTTRPIRPAGGWVAALLVAGLVASAWFLASQGSPAPAPQASAPVEAMPAAPTDNAAERPPPVAMRVPKVEGLLLDAARAALVRSGLTVGRLIIQDSALAGDTVLLVSPAAGSAVAIGSAVELVVASGSNGVPAVVGLIEADAIAAVEAAGFVARVRTVESGADSPGTVVECTPEERTVLRLGNEVQLVVAESKPVVPTPSSSPSPVPSPDATPDAHFRGQDAPSTRG